MVTMAKSLKALLTMTGAAVALSACASADDVAALRQPAMPPVAIAKAAQHKPFFRNVSLQAVEGAPEFRWFDGGAIIIFARRWKSMSTPCQRAYVILRRSVTTNACQCRPV